MHELLDEDEARPIDLDRERVGPEAVARGLQTAELVRRDAARFRWTTSTGISNKPLIASEQPLQFPPDKAASQPGQEGYHLLVGGNAGVARLNGHDVNSVRPWHFRTSLVQSVQHSGK